MRPWVNANMTAVAKLSHAVPAYAASVGGCQEHIRATEAFSPSMNDHLCWPQVSQCSTQPMEERPSHGLLLQDSLKSCQSWHAHSMPNSPCMMQRQPTGDSIGAAHIEGRMSSWPREHRGPFASEEAAGPVHAQWCFQEWPQPVFKVQTDALEDDATSPLAVAPRPRTTTSKRR